MKRTVVVILALLLGIGLTGQEKKVYRGFDGGMMIHTGYLHGNIEPIGYKISGAPIGLRSTTPITTSRAFSPSIPSWAVTS